MVKRTFLNIFFIVGDERMEQTKEQNKRKERNVRLGRF